MKHIELDLQVHEYPSYYKFENFMRFYEELEDCLKELKKLLEIVEIFLVIGDNPSSSKSKFNEISQKNFEMIKLNFNFLQGLFNLFKFNDDHPIQRILKKIYYYQIYIYISEQFCRLRKLYQDNYFFQSGEEERYMDSLKMLYGNKSNFFPSKNGFLYLRHVRYYTFKINKYLFKNRTEKSQNKLSYYNAKVNYLCVVSCHCLTRYENSLFEESFNSERWQIIKKNSDFDLVKCFSNGEKHRKFSRWFTNFINALYYSIDMPNFKTSIQSVTKLFINVVYFALFSKASKSHRTINTTKPCLKMSKHIFESYESPLINIPYTLMRTHSKINLKFFIELYGVNYNGTDSKNYIGLKMKEGERNDNKYPYTNSKNVFNFRLITNMEEFEFKDIVIKRDVIERKSEIKVVDKALCKKKEFLNEFIHNEKKSLEGMKNKILNLEDDSLPQIDVLFYLHGGGFISQTTESCVGFLSDVCSKIPCIIFSFDYHLFPEHSLSQIINECNQAFELLILNASKLFKISIRKLILSGDSAGGFLTLQLTNYIIKNNLRKPDRIILLYPCSRLFLHEVTPSNYLTLTEYFIDTPYVNEIRKIGKYTTIDDPHKYKNPEKNENFSFYLTPDDIIRQFPKIYLVLASNDPLRDDSYKLADFFLSKNVTVDVKEFLFFPHGFMNLTSIVDNYYLLGLEYYIDCIKNGFDDFEPNKK